MQIEISTENELAVAVISGEIDGKTAPQAQSELLPAMGSCGKIVLEMSGVTFLSSAGLRTLLLLYRQAVAKDGRIALVGLSDEIKDVMSMTGFLKFFVVENTLDDGKRALN
jgi:anti-sigma B factor antagonist